MFTSIATEAFIETDGRRYLESQLLRYGIDFLDHCFRGIFPDDLILLGAQSGLGKTQLTCLIAQANLQIGKRVHMIALESSTFEVTRRLKYQLFGDAYFGDPTRSVMANINYTDWHIGKFLNNPDLEKYEIEASEKFDAMYKNLFIFRKQQKFDVDDLVESILDAQDGRSDLIIIDHAHYFDYDHESESRALKEITKVLRQISQEVNIPVILVGHLRKSNKFNDDLAPGMEEFHGSSDLYKIATKVITLAPGEISGDGRYETFFRLSKNRIDGSVTKYLGRLLYDPKRSAYSKGYKIGWHDTTKREKFGELAANLLPRWATSLSN